MSEVRLVWITPGCYQWTWSGYDCGNYICCLD